jgi:hypothetical protein
VKLNFRRSSLSRKCEYRTAFLFMVEGDSRFSLIHRYHSTL